MTPEVVRLNRVSASVVSKDSDLYFAQICNFSDLPIYRVIISVVNIQNIATDGLETPIELRYLYSIVPPGVWHEPITIQHGAGFCSGLEIAFTNSEGKSWVRNGLGRIRGIPLEPHQYYSLPLPLEWNYVTLRQTEI